MAAGAAGEQLTDALADGLRVGGECGEVCGVAARRVERVEDVGKLAREAAAQATGRAATLAQRDEVAQDVREAELAAAVVDEQVHRVAIGHDHAARVVAQQRLGAVAVAAVRELKQRGLLGGRDRQPMRAARPLPAGLISTANRAAVDRGEHLGVGVLQRVGRLLDQRLADAALIWTPNRSPAAARPLCATPWRPSASRPLPRPPARRPAGTPAGNSASVQRPQSQRARIRRCSVTCTRTMISLTWRATGSPSATRWSIGLAQPAHADGQCSTTRSGSATIGRWRPG